MNLRTLRHDVNDGVLTVTLHRPDSLNAFTVEMADELEWTFRHVNDRDDVRAVIVTGAGRAFCAGMDLAETGNPFGLDETLRPTLADMAELDDPGLRRVRDTGGRVTLAIHACRKPVIAAINGPAVGIGATMTLAMDARLISERGRIGFVFGRLGITPEAASTWFLPRIVGMDTALDLLYSAEILDAQSALQKGLVRSVHGNDLLTAATQLADRWTKGKSPVAVALARQLLYRNATLEHPVDAHRVDSLAMFYTSIADGAEGVAAFREKRDPRFTGKASSDMPPFYDDWTE
ncbi:crotonase/enoyl-CoA hydratase family protein [Mycobacterium sp. SMC-4]|uniref:crotonase/enoyl-CoA hydratase family protein n=1 Tax=Mycobacterium sp. SMC-4 TaxID=2857059 RepID=UPI003D006979